MYNESLEDKKRQRDKYEIFVKINIKSIKYGTDFFKKFLGFFFGTVVLGSV